MKLAFCLLLPSAGCGLLSRDFDVSREFPAGGGAPAYTGEFPGQALTGQLSSDLNKISSITLKAARIDAIDGAGDVSFVSSGSIEVSGNQLATVKLATISAPAPAGATSVAFTVSSSTELKPYLQQNGNVAVSSGIPPRRRRRGGSS